MKFAVSPAAGENPALQDMIQRCHWVLPYDALGNSQPFGPGCIFYLMPSGVDHAEEAIPLMVTHMSRGTMHARCACGQDNCSRKVKFSATWGGKHPQSPRDER